MLYLSAQPDQLYFIWQLEIQLRNFHALGILKHNIQVLVSYKQERGLNPLFQEFIEVNSDLAQFYTYPDLREKPNYTSSVRPNILKQHFERYPELSKVTIMYHDSDILFSRIPKIDNVEENDICYVSNTRNYLDVNYILQRSSEELLYEMLKIVGLSKEKLFQEDSQTGGAQYILKGINASFWEKVERDCEELYVLMTKYNEDLWEREYPLRKSYKSAKRGIQAWCADMWAVLWNLWCMNKKVEIHSEMDFSWPFSPIDEWKSKSIQHYSGNIEDRSKYFKKSEYLNYTPWYDDSLYKIPNTSCSFEIVNLIKQRRNEIDEQRIVLKNVCIIIPVILESELTQFQIVKRYFQKYIDVNIFSNLDLVQRDYETVVHFPNGFIMDWQHLYQMILNVKNGSFYNITELYRVDSLFTETFSKVLDIGLLEKNKGKFNIMNQKPDKSIEIKVSIKDVKEPATQRYIQEAFFLT